MGQVLGKQLYYPLHFSSVNALSVLDHSSQHCCVICRLLQKSRLKYVHNHTIRDSLRNDVSKVTWMLHEVQCKSEEKRLKIIKLGQVINGQEQDLLHIRKSHDASVQSRNERWVRSQYGATNKIFMFC